MLTAETRYESPGTVRVDISDASSGGHVMLSGLHSPPPDADFLVPMTLVPAMAQHLDLALPRIESAMLRAALPALQRIFAAWHPAMRVARISARCSTPTTPVPSRGRGIAAFFSGGVDSFYTALALRDRLDALVFVSGFDLALGRPNEPDPDQVAAKTESAANRLALPLLHFRTTLRTYSDRCMLWGDHYVGSALAAVALLLTNEFRSVIIPATHLARHDFAYGTHPRTDPLWSTERMQIRMHGSAVARPSKVAHISASAVAMDVLRVCWENPDGEYNCGTCEKCQRTMVELYLAGALDRCQTLPDDIDLRALTRLPTSDPSRRSFAVSLLHAARTSDQPLARHIASAIQSALRAGDGPSTR